MPLIETFRAAEDLANVVDRQMRTFKNGEHEELISKIHETMAAFMLHLARGFPQEGMPHPHQSLENAKEHLIQLQMHIQALLLREQGIAAGNPLEDTCAHVLSRLEHTLSVMKNDPPTVTTRRYIQTLSAMKYPEI